jgi:hypothetical protein
MTSIPPHIRIRSCTVRSPWQRVPRTRTMSRFTYAKPVGSAALCVAGTDGPALANGDKTTFPNTIRGRKRSRSRRNSGVIVIFAAKCHCFRHTDALFDCSTSLGGCLQTFPQFSGHLLSISQQDSLDTLRNKNQCLTNRRKVPIWMNISIGVCLRGHRPLNGTNGGRAKVRE